MLNENDSSYTNSIPANGAIPHCHIVFSAFTNPGNRVVSVDPFIVSCRKKAGATSRSIHSSHCYDLGCIFDQLQVTSSSSLHYGCSSRCCNERCAYLQASTRDVNPLTHPGFTHRHRSDIHTPTSLSYRHGMVVRRLRQPSCIITLQNPQSRPGMAPLLPHIHHTQQYLSCTHLLPLHRNVLHSSHNRFQQAHNRPKRSGRSQDLRRLGTSPRRNRSARYASTPESGNMEMVDERVEILG